VQAELHDRYFLPSNLWMDLAAIVTDLRAIDLDFGKSGLAMFREIWEWRFPTLLEADGVIVRRACEGWPLLCETPLEGGSTSRFVDTSMDRLEFSVPAGIGRELEIAVAGRPARLLDLAEGLVGFGLRYRRSALYPSLHPGIAPQLPLDLEIRRGDRTQTFRLSADQPQFVAGDALATSVPDQPCRRASEEWLTYDLRL
jgi:uncharacterized protein (DUF2126 family)